MTDTQKTTNERIAELMLEQTYNERMEMARAFLDAIDDWPGNGTNHDSDSMAAMLDGWAQVNLPPEEA